MTDPPRDDNEPVEAVSRYDDIAEGLKRGWIDPRQETLLREIRRRAARGAA